MYDEIRAEMNGRTATLSIVFEDGEIVMATLESSIEGKEFCFRAFRQGHLF